MRILAIFASAFSAAVFLANYLIPEHLWVPVGGGLALLGLGLGPRRGWGLHPPPRRALPPGLSLPLSKAFFVPMPTNLGRASPWKAFAPNPSGCASLLPCG